MKNNKNTKNIILIFLILFFCLLCLLLLLVVYLQNNKPKEAIVIQNTETPSSPEDIINKYDSEYIDRIDNIIYVNFSKDLFDKDGSNKSFFENMIRDLEPFIKESFYLYDKEKDITFYVKYDYENKTYTITINNNENIDEFYDKVDGEDYVRVDDVTIVDRTVTAVDNYFLELLALNNCYLSGIQDEIGEGKDLGNGYTSYLDDSIKIRLAPTKAVQNIIFTKKYDGNITTSATTKMDLKEIADGDPNYVFGGIGEGYLGYRLSDYYIFYYEDEVSAYTYSYKENNVFEGYLKEYLETKDLNTFIENLKTDWKAYDTFEYNPETNSAHIFYSTRGVEINIQNNNPSQITFYQNYCFSDYTKSLVKQGIVKLNANTDSVQKIEQERRNNN